MHSLPSRLIEHRVRARDLSADAVAELRHALHGDAQTLLIAEWDVVFDDETLPEARRTRDPVVPAKPTERARDKKARRRTDDGLALHSLATLIAELTTRCRNTCRVLSDPTAPAFSLLAHPTETRRRAVELIEMIPVPGPVES